MNAKKIPPKQTTFQYAQACQQLSDGTLDSLCLILGLHRAADTATARIWAPSATQVFLCGDFNAWNEDSHPLHRSALSGVWELCIDARTLLTGDCYRFRVLIDDAELLLADPVGAKSVTAPDGKPATLICDPDAYQWRDAGWIRYRAERFLRTKLDSEPINIYEIHPDTCILSPDGKPLPPAALARELAPYVKQMGYTHVELMTSTDSPSCLSPVLSSGSPADWMGFVDGMHEAGIGVILDWSPACAVSILSRLVGKDEQASGPTCPNAALMHGEICSILRSSAITLIKTYHLDGIYVDAAPLLHHADCPMGIMPEHLTCPQRASAARFIRALDVTLAKHLPDVITVASDRTLSEAGVQGACFSLRRDNGWTEDTVSYFQKDPLWRKYEHQKLTLPISYAFSASYLLALPHDCMGENAGSLLDRMPGEYEQKFANVRLLLAQMMLRPGKKHLFMGAEIGTFRSWSQSNPIEWFLTDHTMHASLQHYCADLNHFYLEQPALWELDSDRRGFGWIDASNAEESICSFCRTAKNGDQLIAVLNLTPVEREGFLLSVPDDGIYEEIFNSDAPKYGGRGNRNAGVFAARSASLSPFPQAIRITLPPLAALVFKRVK